MNKYRMYILFLFKWISNKENTNLFEIHLNLLK